MKITILFAFFVLSVSAPLFAEKFQFNVTSERAVVGEQYEYYIKKTLSDIFIDGVLDEEWSLAQEKLVEKPAGIEAPLSDLSGLWKALWDDNNLYIFVEIHDGAPTLQKSAGLEHDAIHIYIDSDRDVHTTENNFTYEVNKLSSVIIERLHGALTGIEFKTIIRENGFDLELKIPWSTLKKETTTDKFHIEIRALDYPDRNASLPEAAVAWYSAGAQNPFETGNLGTAFLGDVNVPENLLPEVLISAPDDGAAISLGEALTISAEPFDADGTINHVEFYADNNYLGNDRNNLDGWSIPWNDILPGTHSLYVRAFDDSGDDTTSDTLLIVVFKPDAETVLLVAGDELTTAEIAIKQRFEQELAYQVVVADDDSVATSDAENRALIYLSESIDHTKMSDVFTESIIPIICANPYLLADLKMTASILDTDFGITASDYDSITILWPDHALAAGLQDSPHILKQAGKLIWGTPSEQAQKIAGVPDQLDQYVIFAYERRDQMVGLSAPSSRVGFFLYSRSAPFLNENGWALFDAAVRWAIDKHITPVQEDVLPIDHALIANYPNPFNPETHFVVLLEETQMTTIKIFDLRGRCIKTLTHNQLAAGRHEFVWDATNEVGQKMSSSVYLVQIILGADKFYKKITLLK